jgi:hypothetical protein
MRSEKIIRTWTRLPERSRPEGPTMKLMLISQTSPRTVERLV